ncbi:hypothetical protein HBH77_246600 [Parastagonospora nodorum]|nr:hypothetical protein HBH77_246600 [Parastagonospora nodorum]
MCAKDDLIRRKEELATAESVTAKDPNHVDTFGLDFAFSLLIARGNVSNATSGLSRLKADQHFFVYQNILSLIAFIISHRPFADELNIQQSLLDRATVVPIIISVDKTQLSLILGDIAAWLVYVIIRNLSCEARRQRSTPGTLLAGFIPTTKIRDPLLKSQVYHYCMGKLLSQQFTRLQQERCLNKGHDDFHHNFNIHVSLATDTLHLLLKGLVIKMLDFMQDITTPVTQESSSTQLNERFRQVMHSTSLKHFNNKRAFTEAIIQQLIAVVSPLFISKAPFALHFIRAVCDLVTLAQYKSHDEDTLAYIQGALERMNIFKEEFRHALTHIIQDIRMYGALDGICTRANSEAHHITIVKQFYSITNKKEYILQICLHNSQRTALLAADHATIVKQSRPSTTIDIQDRTYSTRSIPGIQPHSTKLPLSEVAANIAISNFTHAAAVFVRNKRQAAAGQLITSYNEDRLDINPSWVGRISVQIHPSIKCWRSSSKRHNDPKHCNEEVQEFKHRDNRRQSRTVTDSRVVAQLHLILTIIDHTRYDKDRKHMAYIRAFSEVLLFNNNRQINNTTRMLSVPFKFYDLSTIIRPVHLVPRDLPNSTTRTTMSYYVNNYIN